MKLVAYAVERTQNRTSDFRFVFTSPLLSTKSYIKLRDENITKRKLFLKASLYGVAVVSHYYLVFLSCFHVSELALRYLCAPGIYFLTLWMSTSFQLIFSFTGVTPVDMHDRPYLAYSLTDFWSKRWNRWVRDWLNTLTVFLKMIHVKWGAILAFLISGFFHEVMFTLPYYLFTGESYFGYMMLFFFFQAVGVLFEKTILKRSHPTLRRVFMWLMILGLSPLFIQRPLLVMIGLTS